MDDDRVWAFEESLWTGDADNYRAKMDEACLVVVPAEPYVQSGEDAVKAVANTPRWESATFSDTRISRPQEGLIVIAYRVEATRGDETYEAHCSSVYRRLEHEEWRVVQHQQTPPIVAGGAD